MLVLRLLPARAAPEEKCCRSRAGRKEEDHQPMQELLLLPARAAPEEKCCRSRAGRKEEEHQPRTEEEQRGSRSPGPLQSPSCSGREEEAQRKMSDEVAGAMAAPDVKPKSISRAKQWSDEIENLYRFQQAGYRDEIEYKQVKHVEMVDRWPDTGFVKKLQRRNNTFYYYDRQRECEDKEVHKVKVYAY